MRGWGGGWGLQSGPIIALQIAEVPAAPVQVMTKGPMLMDEELIHSPLEWLGGVPLRGEEKRPLKKILG